VGCLAQVSESLDVSAFKVRWLLNAYYIDRGHFVITVTLKIEVLRTSETSTSQFTSVHSQNLKHDQYQQHPQQSQISCYLLPYCTTTLTNPHNVFLEKPIVSQMFTQLSVDYRVYKLTYLLHGAESFLRS
jgi:hypothetical protein